MKRLLFAVFALGVLAGCGDRTLFAAQPWPSDHHAIVAITDDQDRPVSTAPIFYSAGVPVKLPLPATLPIRFHIETYPREGSDLETCGVAFTGDGDLLTDAATRWVSNVVDSTDEETLELSAETSERAFELRKATCMTPPEPMVTANSYREPSLPFTTLHEIQRIDDNRWFVEGRDLQTNKRMLAILRRDGATRLENIPPIEMDPVGFAFDPAENVLFAVWKLGEMLQVDPNGDIVASLTIPGFVPEGLELAGPGRAIVYNKERAYEWLARNSTVTASTESFPPGMTELFVARDGSRSAIAEARILDLVEGTWTPALGGQDIQMGDRHEPITANDSVQIFVGEQDIRIRNGGEAKWTPLEHPFVSGGTFAGVPIGHGLLAVGFGGRSSIWANGRWTRIETDAVTGFRGISATTDEHFAIGVGSGEDVEGPRIVTFEIPVLP